MGDLSKNFSKSEFICPCCGDMLIDPRLVEALQQLRKQARQPVTVLSGYRCERHNKEVGGSKYSQHLRGRAADIVIDGYSPTSMKVLAESIPAFAKGGIGVYHDQGFVHVDVRKKKARW